MSGVIKKLSSHALIYGLGNVAVRVVSFLLLPLYLEKLTVANYGRLEMCMVISTLLQAIFLLGIGSSLFKVFFQESDINNKRVILSSSLLFYFVYAGTISVILMILSKFLGNLFLAGEQSGYLWNLVVVATFLEGLLVLILAIFRAKEKPLKYVTVIFVRVLIYSLFNIMFILYFAKSIVGVRESVVISLIVAIVVSLLLKPEKINFKFDAKYIKEMIYIGFPLAISSLLVWIYNGTDRFMMKFLLPEGEAFNDIGIYSLGTKLASIIKIGLSMPFMTAWGPLMFAYSKKDNAKEIYAKVFRVYTFVAFTIAGLSLFIIPNILSFLTTKEDYFVSLSIFPILVLNAIIGSYFVIFTTGITLKRKTKYITFADFIGALINIALNYMLIEKYSYMGAAFASLTAMLINVAILAYYSQKLYYIPFYIKRTILLFVLFVLTIMSRFFISVDNYYKIVLVCLLSIFCFGFIKKDEYIQLWDKINKWRKRK